MRSSEDAVVPPAPERRMKLFSSDWWDRQMAETWPAYALFAGLLLVGCCCGACLAGPIGWLIGR